HVGEALKNVGAIALGHAPDDTDDKTGPRLLPVTHLTQPRPDLLLGMLAHRAGVVDHYVGALAIFSRVIALGAELTKHELAVEHVHLAAEGFEVQLAWHCEEVYGLQALRST